MLAFNEFNEFQKLKELMKGHITLHIQNDNHQKFSVTMLYCIQK